MLFSRATWMLSYYSVNTYERIRQEVEIWSLDTTSVITASQSQLRVDTCMALTMSHCNYQWFHNFITGDEKWVLYVKHTRKYQWLGTGQTGIVTSKNDLYPRKIMLSVW